MATTRTVRQNVRNTKTGSNAMNIQKAINKDYELLLRDYRKLGIELWQMPLTKFIVGGAALGALAPLLVKVFRGDVDIDVIKDKIVDFVHMARSESQDLTE